MKQNTKNGYFSFEIKQEGKETILRTLHFSMNCWAELEADTKEGIVKWSENYAKLTDRMEQAKALSSVMFASAKAHDLEEGNDIDYNIYQVRGIWINSLSEAQAKDFVKAMMWSTQPNLGKAGKPQPVVA